MNIHLAALSLLEARRFAVPKPGEKLIDVVPELFERFSLIFRQLAQDTLVAHTREVGAVFPVLRVGRIMPFNSIGPAPPGAIRVLAYRARVWRRHRAIGHPCPGPTLQAQCRRGGQPGGCYCGSRIDSLKLGNRGFSRDGLSWIQRTCSKSAKLPILHGNHRNVGLTHGLATGQCSCHSLRLLNGPPGNQTPFCGV